MIYVLYGQPGSGKTTLGELLADHLETPFIIDGDEFRKIFSNRNYGKIGREENIRNANAVATYLNKKSYPKGHVVISLVNPYKYLREELKTNNTGQVIEILLHSNRDLRKEYHVENFEEGTPYAAMNTDNDVKHSWIELKSKLKL
jgi:adenylylsulfate kinase-like enzyme